MRLASPALAFLTVALLARLAVSADMLFQLGNFPSCFLLVPDDGNSLVIDLGLAGDLPVGLLGLRLDQLGDQLAFLLGGEVAAVNVLADDVAGRIVNEQVGGGTLGACGKAVVAYDRFRRPAQYPQGTVPVTP